MLGSWNDSPSECIIDIAYLGQLQGVQLSGLIQLFYLFLNPFSHKHSKC